MRFRTLSAALDHLPTQMFFFLRSSYVGNTAVLAALLNFFPLLGFCFTLISRECREMRANPQLLRSLVVGAGNVKDVVFRALRPKGPLDRQGEIDGTCLEGLVFSISPPGTTTAAAKTGFSSGGQKAA